VSNPYEGNAWLESQLDELRAENARLRAELETAKRLAGQLPAVVIERDRLLAAHQKVDLETMIQNEHRLYADAHEKLEAVQSALLVMLGHVDYTKDACGMGEAIGGVLPPGVLATARAALGQKGTQKP